MRAIGPLVLLALVLTGLLTRGGTRRVPRSHQLAVTAFAGSPESPVQEAAAPAPGRVPLARAQPPPRSPPSPRPVLRRLAGRVLAGGRPVAGAAVHAHRPIQVEWNHPIPWGLVGGELASRVELQPVGEARSDIDGNFVLELPAGDPWRLHATASGLAQGDPPWVNVGSSTRSGVELLLERTGGIRGRLLGTGPQRGEWVGASDGEGHLAFARSDVDGRYALGGLAPGAWQVRHVGRSPVPFRIGIAWPLSRGARPPRWDVVVPPGKTVRMDVPLGAR